MFYILTCYLQSVIGRDQSFLHFGSPVKQFSGLLIDDSIIIQLFLQFDIHPLCVHNFHQNPINFFIEDLIVCGELLVLSVESVSFQNGIVEIVLEKSLLVFEHFNFFSLLLVLTHHHRQILCYLYEL